VAHGSQFGKLSIETKTIYAGCGDVNSCGDWLAVALKDAFRTGNGGLDLAAFKACLKKNDVTPPSSRDTPSLTQQIL
jgi:hypothetical protein